MKHIHIILRKLKLIRAFALALSTLMLLRCSTKADDNFKVGLVFDRGGKDDKSFNASAYEGALRAKRELGVYIKYVEATDDNAYESLLRGFTKKKYDLIISVGFAQKDAIEKVAPQFPGQRFAIVDSSVKAPNVRALLFEEHEGAYLVGAIAALSAKRNTIGFVGGMDIPIIRRFELGYKAGAKQINSNIRVLVNYVGVTGEAWNNPAKGKEIALSQYERGADVIFSAAGASGLGIFDAAEEQKKYTIGVDSNQNSIKPGFILTSMLKRVDNAVFSTIRETQKGNFTAGVIHLGLKEEGVGYAVDKYNEKLITEAMRKKLDALTADIIANRIAVDDYYKLR